MKYSSINKIINEGYSRSYDFDYSHFSVDPRPKVLSLGKWVNHLGNSLICGIAVNALDEEQFTRLRTHLPSILKSRNLKKRVNYIRRNLPDIFRAYRTYRADRVSKVNPGTIKFMHVPKPDKASPEKEPLEPKKMGLDRIGSVADRVKQRIDKMSDIDKEKPEEEPEIEKPKVDKEKFTSKTKPGSSEPDELKEPVEKEDIPDEETEEEGEEIQDDGLK
jgi:hypothetical protein